MKKDCTLITARTFFRAWNLSGGVRWANVWVETIRSKVSPRRKNGFEARSPTTKRSPGLGSISGGSGRMSAPVYPGPKKALNLSPAQAISSTVTQGCADFTAARNSRRKRYLYGAEIVMRSCLSSVLALVFGKYTTAEGYGVLWFHGELLSMPALPPDQEHSFRAIFGFKRLRRGDLGHRG